MMSLSLSLSIYLFHFLSSSGIYPYFDFSTNFTHVIDSSGFIIPFCCDCSLSSFLHFDSSSFLYILPLSPPPAYSSSPLPIDSPSPIGLPPSHPSRASDLLDDLHLLGSEDNDGSTEVIPLSSSPPPPYHSLPHEILDRASSLSSVSVPAVVSPVLPAVEPVVSVVLPVEPSDNVPYGPEPLANVPYGPAPMG